MLSNKVEFVPKLLLIHDGTTIGINVSSYRIVIWQYRFCQYMKKLSSGHKATTTVGLPKS